MPVSVVFLIIGADRRVRAVKRLPELRNDEVAIAMRLRFTEDWGRIIQNIEVDVPPLITGAEMAS